MAIGDDATAAGFPLVPQDGVAPEALVKMGFQEINRTRDFIARRSRQGAALPANTVGQNGDIFFRII